jgi:hypothetical protein
MKSTRATAPVGGATRNGRTIDARSDEFRKLKAGEGALTSITPEQQEAFVGPRTRTGKTSKGGFTDLGEFKKGGKTLRELSGSKKGLGLFGSAAQLAKIFASKEFQQRKAKGIQAAAGIKGRRADVKQQTEQMKVYSTIRSKIAETDPDSPIIEQIDDLIAGGLGIGSQDADMQLQGQLAQKFDNDTVAQIWEIIKNGRQ